MTQLVRKWCSFHLTIVMWHHVEDQSPNSYLAGSRDLIDHCSWYSMSQEDFFEHQLCYICLILSLVVQAFLLVVLKNSLKIHGSHVLSHVQFHSFFITAI